MAPPPKVGGPVRPYTSNMPKAGPDVKGVFQDLIAGMECRTQGGVRPE